MKLTKCENGVILNKDDGSEMQLSWNDFWELCREGSRIDIENEIKAFLDDAEPNIGLALLNNKHLMDCVIENVYQIRTNNETIDEILDAIEVALISN